MPKRPKRRISYSLRSINDSPPIVNRPRRKLSQTVELRGGSNGVQVFMGPAVGGVDKEYVKIISGKVDNRKPSFI
jgi:hypothetical protein